MESQNVVEGQSGDAGMSYVKNRQDEPPMPTEPPPARHSTVPPQFRPDYPA
jgi:hypothetical protein